MESYKKREKMIVILFIILLLGIIFFTLFYFDLIDFTGAFEKKIPDQQAGEIKIGILSPPG